MSSKQAIYKHKWWIFLAMSVAVAMSNIELTAVNLALASIGSDLHLSLHNMQWIINAFLLFNASLIVMGGKLADIFGRRRVFLYGVAVFLLASLMGGLAQNTTEIILSRILQGASTAIGITITTVIIYTAFPPEERNMALGLLTGIIGFSLAIGPTLGGFLTEILNWRWIFFINVPLGLLSIILTLWYTPKDSHKLIKNSVDYAGIATLSLGVGGLIFAMSQVNQWPLLSWNFLSIFFLAILSLIIFYWLERRQQHPLIVPEILMNLSFWLGCLVRMLIIYIIYVPLFIISLYMQNILDYTPSKAGLVMLAMTLTIGIFSPIGGWLTNRFGARIVVLISTVFAILVFFLLSRLTTQTTSSHLSFILFCAGIVYGMFSPAILRATMETVTEDKLSIASGIFYMMSVTGGALSTAIATTIMIKDGRNHLHNLATQNNVHLSTQQIANIMQTLFSSHSGRARHLHVIHNMSPPITNFSKEAFMYAFSHIMLLGAFLSLLATLIVFLNFKHARRSNAVPLSPSSGRG